MDNSGSAFPVLDASDAGLGCREFGLSKREYAAIHLTLDEDEIPATVKDCADLIGIKPEDYHYSKHWFLVKAKCRLLQADALIAALKEGE